MSRMAFIVTAFFAVGCATSTAVKNETAEIEAALKPLKENALACAPTEIAEAESRIVFARYDSSRGRTLQARQHLDAASANLEMARQKSSGERCEGDRDGDGISDAIDQCPDIPEDFDGEDDQDGCPDIDRDRDKVADDRDKCPSQPEDIDGFEDQDGCPEFDNDKDGLPDMMDQCPNQPEDHDQNQDQDGCPDGDNDGDDVPDAEDRCPTKPGTKETGGCPDDYRLLVFREDVIELRQPVSFQKATGNLLPQASPVIEELAQLLKANGSVKLRIEGHTDAEGADDVNLAISKKVAENVKKALVAKGISGARLTTVGKGELSPIDENDTEEGRAVNRRVEFYVVR